MPRRGHTPGATHLEGEPFAPLPAGLSRNTPAGALGTVQFAILSIVIP
ncbi:MAG: hypothetical protein ACI8PT_000949 [Gammaproteobacteria bacterium]|jgi:hypothetical protein